MCQTSFQDAHSNISSWIPNAPDWSKQLIVDTYASYIFGIILFLIIIYSFAASRQRKSKHLKAHEMLAKECESLANDIEEFIFERNSQSPTFHSYNYNGTIEEGKRGFIERSQYSEKTRHLYVKKFSGRLSALVEKLKTNGHHPSGKLTFGDDAWHDIKLGKLRNYAQTLINNGTINDK